jgi:hypothetical protein
MKGMELLKHLQTLNRLIFNQVSIKAFSKKGLNVDELLNGYA